MTMPNKLLTTTI